MNLRFYRILNVIVRHETVSQSNIKQVAASFLPEMTRISNVFARKTLLSQYGVLMNQSLSLIKLVPVFFCIPLHFV
jgi:hypothetical protein